MQVSGVDGLVDYGEVGDVVSVNGALLSSLAALDVVPVVGTLGVDDGGRIFNINADTTAVKVAKELRADVLLLVTAVGGVFRDIKDKSSRFGTLSPRKRATSSRTASSTAA